MTDDNERLRAMMNGLLAATEGVVRQADENQRLAAGLNAAGCEHGVKPARNCTHPDCRGAKLHRLLDLIGPKPEDRRTPEEKFLEAFREDLPKVLEEMAGSLAPQIEGDSGEYVGTTFATLHDAGRFTTVRVKISVELNAEPELDCEHETVRPETVGHA